MPTIYSTTSLTSPTPHLLSSPTTITTNQYAVTEQSHLVGERAVPGVFFKFDIEPILLMVEESRAGFLRFCVKVVNLLSGVLVAGHWAFILWGWCGEVLGGRRRRQSDGVLHGRSESNEEE